MPDTETKSEDGKGGFAGASCYGALVDALLDDAFQVLQHDTGESDTEWHEQRKWLAEKFKKTLRTKKRHNEKLSD